MLTRRRLLNAIPALAVSPFLGVQEVQAETRNRRANIQIYLAPGEAVGSWKRTGPHTRAYSSVLTERFKKSMQAFEVLHPGMRVTSDITCIFMQGDWKPISEPVTIRSEAVPEMIKGKWSEIDHALELSIGTPIEGRFMERVEQIKKMNAAKADINMVEINFYVA